MKRFFYLCILLCAAFTSCKKDENIIDGPYDSRPPVFDTFLDGGEIESLSLSCLDYPFYDTNSTGVQGNANDAKTINDYTFMQLNVEFNLKWYDNTSYKSEKELEQDRAIRKIEKDYLRDKAAFLYSECQKHNYVFPAFFTAYTNGEVTITCDNVLFGEQPGSNLSKYFIIKLDPNCIIAGRDSTKIIYNAGDKIPNHMDKYFKVKETFIATNYRIRFAFAPEEKYDALTFKISFPLLIDDVHKYALSQYHGFQEPLESKERVMEAECKVKFKW